MIDYIQVWIYLMAGLSVFWVLYIVWRHRTARTMAAEVYAARQEDDASVRALGQEKFERAYMRSNGPRPAIFAALGSVAALLSMPIAFVVSERVFHLLWSNSGQAADLEYGLAPWLFFMTLLMICCWIAILAVFARAYHHNRPGTLDMEIKRERELT